MAVHFRQLVHFENQGPRHRVSGEDDVLRNVALPQVGGKAYRIESRNLQEGADTANW